MRTEKLVPFRDEHPVSYYRQLEQLARPNVILASLLWADRSEEANQYCLAICCRPDTEIGFYHLDKKNHDPRPTEKRAHLHKT